MRFFGMIAVLAMACGPAVAQGWTEYSYPTDAFTVAFPAAPKIETTTFQTPDGRGAAARVYSVTQESGVLRMTVADLPAATAEQTALVDDAVKALVAGGDIKVDIPHRISAVYGRQLTIVAADGRRSQVAVFYHKQRLYQIEGVAMPTHPDGNADAIRFQQSLTFLDNAAKATPRGQHQRHVRAV